MAVPTNTFTTETAVGNRESLHDIISILDKDETPFQSMVGSGTAEATREEWQLDDIGAANTNNSHLEGDDTAGAAITPTERVSNLTQIMKRPFTISGTQEAVKKAGRESEVSYQKALAGRRAKIDLEATIFLNQASRDQNGADTRRLGGIPTWIETNVSRGAGGSSGGYSLGVTTVAVDGTQRPFIEQLLRVVVKGCWEQGGKPRALMMNGYNKQKFSGFTGIAMQTNETSGKNITLQGAVDRYKSDFGTFDAVANRYVRERECHVIDPSLYRILWLRKWKSEALAKTGDAFKHQLLGEMTLESRNEKGNGIVADLTTAD